MGSFRVRYASLASREAVVVSRRLSYPQTIQWAPQKNRLKTALNRDLSGTIHFAVTPCVVFRKNGHPENSDSPIPAPIRQKSPILNARQKGTPGRPGGYDSGVSRRKDEKKQRCESNPVILASANRPEQALIRNLSATTTLALTA